MTTSNEYEVTLKVLERMKNDLGIDYPKDWLPALLTTIDTLKIRYRTQDKLKEIGKTLDVYLNDAEIDPSWTFDNSLKDWRLP